MYDFQKKLIETFKNSCSTLLSLFPSHNYKELKSNRAYLTSSHLIATLSLC